MHLRTYFGHERRQRRENILVVHLGTNFISTVDTQISVWNPSPGGEKKKKVGMRNQSDTKQKKKNDGLTAVLQQLRRRPLPQSP